MMRSKLAVAAVLAVLALCGLAVPAAAQPWKGVGTLGLEVKAGRRDPLEGAQVRLRYAEIDPIDGPPPVTTDANGRVEVQGLAAGRWRVDISKEGYSSYLLVVAVESHGETRIVSGPVRDATGERMRIELFEVTPDALAGPALEIPPEARPRERPRPEPAPPARPEPAPARPEPAPPARPEPTPAQPEPTPAQPEPTPVEPAPVEPPPAEPKPMPEAAPPEPAAEPEPEAPASAPVAPSEEPGPEPEPEEVPPSAAAPAPAPQPPVEPPTEPEPVAPVAPSEEPGPEPEPEEVPPPGSAAAPEPPAPSQPAPAEEPEPEEVPPPPPAPPAPRPPQPPTPPAAEPPAPPPAAPVAEPQPAPPAAEAPPAEPPVTPSPPSEPSAPPAPARPSPAPPSAPASPAPPAQSPPLPRISATVTSSAEGTCPECQPGQAAVMIEQLVGAAGLAPAEECVSDLAERVDRIAALLAEAGVTAAGPLISGTGGALQLLRGTPAANEVATLVTPFLRRDSSCQALVVVLPPGARYAAYSYQASDAFGSGPCPAGEECAIGSASWTGEPTVVHTDGPTVVYGVFRNASQGRQRRAVLTVYYVP